MCQIAGLHVSALFTLLCAVTVVAVPADRWEYFKQLNYKFPFFFPVYHQIKVLAMGDSRTDKGIDPKYLDFMDSSNIEYPQAFNFAAFGGGINLIRELLESYGYRCKKLEWIVIGISPSYFNANNDRPQVEWLHQSPGYRYDRENATALWKERPDVLVKPKRPDCCDGWTFYGYDASIPDKNKGDRRANFSESNREVIQREVRAALCTGKKAYSFSSKQWNDFVSLLSELENKKINVLGFTPPWHYFVANQPCTDDEGTASKDYDMIIGKLKKLDGSRKNFIFVDIDKKGHSDFTSEEYFNFDHLNTKGARRLTKRLNSIITAHRQAPPDTLKLVSQSVPTTMSVGDSLIVEWDMLESAVTGIVVFASTNEGRSWDRISPKSMPAKSRRYTWPIPDSLYEIPLAGKCLSIRIEEYLGSHADVSKACVMIQESAPTALSTMSFTVVADATVISTRPSENFGTGPGISAQKSATHVMYNPLGRRILHSARQGKRHGEKTGVVIIRPLNTGVKNRASRIRLESGY